MRARKVLVAQRSRACRICTRLTVEGIARVNATIWPEPGVSLRAASYRIAGVRAALAEGLTIEEKSITRHAQHVERSWHKVDGRQSLAPGEIPVHPTDYQSMVSQAAQLGALSMAQLNRRVATGQVDDRELVTISKMGVGAVVQRESLRIKQQEVDTAQGLLAAMFGGVAGLISEDDIPESEVIDVTPVDDLLAEVREERRQLVRLQAGADDGAR